MADGLLTVEEVATRLRVGEKWVYEHAEALGVKRVGKYLRFDWSCVLERLEQGACRLGLQPNDLAQARKKPARADRWEQIGNKVPLDAGCTTILRGKDEPQRKEA